MSRGGSVDPPSSEKERYADDPLVTTSQLARFIGVSQAPAIIDVRIADDDRVDPRLFPSATTARSCNGPRSVVDVCQKGGAATACLRHEGISAQTLEDGFEGWKGSGPEAGADRQSSPDRRAVGRLGCALPTEDRPCPSP